MKLITEVFVKNVSLVDESGYASGRTRFWRDLQDFMAGQIFANIQFDKKLESASAYFQREQLKFDRIYMPEETAEVILEGTGADTRGTLRFVDDHAFGLFLHEASHYLHMIKDGGKFLSPTIKAAPKHLMSKSGKHSIGYTVDIEYEAGYRSLLYSKQYGLFADGDRTVTELNLENMLNYIEILNGKDFKNCDPAVYKRRLEEWKHETEFEEISDYMTVI